MASIFTRIVNREIPAYIVAEDEKFLAFLDKNPIVIGHTLVIPKQEIEYLWDVPDNLIGEMMIFSKKVSKALKLAMECKKVGLGASGFDVPHTHLHLLPINKTDEMVVHNPIIPQTDEEFKTVAKLISNCYDNL